MVDDLIVTSSIQFRLVCGSVLLGQIGLARQNHSPALQGQNGSEDQCRLAKAGLFLGYLVIDYQE